MGKRIRIVSTKEVVQPAESTNQGQNISSEASDPSIGKSLPRGMFTPFLPSFFTCLLF